MSLFKCKMCGGDLEIVEGASIAECEFCGTRQPVPKAVDENLQNLFNRANALRIKSEFDKAEKIYERIIQVDSTQADAYWGLILCKYGIEYVDDPETYEKIPTCHRASYDSIIADDDYKMAIANADMSQRILYEKQAHEIDKIQKEILALAQEEEPYDVFICYKETDPSGARTHDSVIANDIYHQLVGEGFKVFYAAITLEGKLGSAYEPIIFAALNSAKVMLAIGTKPEYFNAVWVKNEWSRFLKIIKNDHSKVLIPCYRDMDAYELPEEFAHLQAQDMSKIGFINDLIHGIQKVVHKDAIGKAVVSAVENSNTAALLKRAFMFLEDGDWTSANEYCEKVLDIDPENAQAYLGKLMAELRVRKKADLKNCEYPFDGKSNYQKIMRFGNASLIKEVKRYNDDIRARNKQNAENRKANIYREAEALAAQNTPRKLIEASDKFKEIPGYRDADARANGCRKKAVQLAYDQAIKVMEEATTSQQYVEARSLFLNVPGNYSPAKERAKECAERATQITYEAALDTMMKAMTSEQYEAARNLFLTVPFDYAPAKEKAEECRAKAKELAEAERKDKIYDSALGFFKKGKENEDISSIEDAIRKFKSVNGWKDSSVQIDRCRAAIADIRDAQERRRIAHDKAVKKRKRKRIMAILVSVMLIMALIPFFDLWSGNYKVYIDTYRIKHFKIPDGVTEISAGAFYDCDSLKSITIPDSVTSIGGSAFSGCSSLSGTNYNNAVYLGNENNPYLVLWKASSKSITSCDIHPNTKIIMSSAFRDCRSLASITIPDGVTEISDDTFYDCSGLGGVTIPDSVTSIDSYAFYGCGNLRSIRFNGTTAEWNAISKGDGLKFCVPATKVICSDGEVAID